MAFGPLIDVPLMSGIFGLLIKFKKQLASALLSIKLPRLLLAMLLAVILITIEEHINCGAYGCTNVIFPPTLLFLLIEELIVLVLARLFHSRSALWPTLCYCVYGILFEFLVGAARADLHQLAITNLLGFILIILWVGLSYAFVAYLPLFIVLEK